jgi:hypothetical protein
MFSSPVPRRHEGRIAIVTKRGAECGGREGPVDERLSTRTVKTRGPGAPEAGAQVRARPTGFAKATVAIGKVHRGERAISP